MSARSAGPELVYAVRRDVLLGDAAWRGVRVHNTAQIMARLDRGEFFPRPAAEGDTSIKQIIPYLVLRDADRIFLMKRTRAGGDARLHDHYSIGVGGHMNPGDDSVPLCLRREWHEELIADFVPEFEFLGLLNDDEVEVGRHHIGIVYLADAAGRPVAVRETDKLSGAFEAVGVVRTVYDRMETWSQLVLDALADRTSAAPSESHA
jgi:predicted NUDIX family phosphoesterase